MQTIDSIENFIEREFQPNYILSPSTIAKRYHRFKLHGFPSAFNLPVNGSQNWYKELVEYGAVFGANDIISKDKHTSKIQFGFKNADLNQRLEKYDDLNALLVEKSNEMATFRLGGMDYLSDKYTYSFTLNLLIAWLIGAFLTGIGIMFVLKSIIKGMVVIAVNLIPLLIVIYFMPYFGLTINPQSLFLLTILSGLCVDDSIYIMMSKETERKQLEFYPILTTSLVLTSGFISFGFSNFNWLSPFLWIFLIGMITALILDIYILPSFKIGSFK